MKKKTGIIKTRMIAWYQKTGTHFETLSWKARYALFCKETGVKTSFNYFQDTLTEHRRPVKLEAPVQRDQLRDEVEFLRWWNRGERAGYVERLLQELQK